MEEDKINTKKNKGNGTFVTIKDGEKTQIYHVFASEDIKLKKECISTRKGINGKVVISSLLVAIVLASGIYGVKQYIEKEEAKDAKELEEENIKSKLNYNIDNADLTVVRTFFDEALKDLQIKKNNNLEAKDIYDDMHNEFILAQDTYDYATHIKEGAKLASKADIYFGIGKYEKYLHAKNYNGIVYFPFTEALPTYSLEEVSGDIVITYLPNDTTPYVKAVDLEEFEKRQDKSYKDKQDALKLEEKMKNESNYNIDNADLTVVNAFFDEALKDLQIKKNNNLEAKDVYDDMYNEFVLAQDTYDYATHIKEGAKLASKANIYFGIGKYEKYLHAKNYNGIVYFPFTEALPTYSLEEISGDIVITYLHNDKTPYVSANDLEEFKKSKEIESYMKSL